MREHRWRFQVGQEVWDEYRAVKAPPKAAVVEARSTLSETWAHWTGQPVAEEMLRLAEENRRLQDLLDRQERDLVALKGHIGGWKRETLAKLRQELLEARRRLALTPGRWDRLMIEIDRILPADKTPESGR